MAASFHHHSSGMNPPDPTQASHGKHSHARAGRWFLAGIGLATALIGLLFVWLMARSYLRAREMRAWPEVECVILGTTIEERRHDPQSPSEFRVDLSFGYEWQDKPYIGDHLTLRGNPWSSKRVLAEKRAAEYPPGTNTTCRVDPANPAFAVLRPDSLAPGYSIWFPALFVIGGMGMAARAVFTPQPGR